MIAKDQQIATIMATEHYRKRNRSLRLMYDLVMEENRVRVYDQSLFDRMIDHLEWCNKIDSDSLADFRGRVLMYVDFEVAVRVEWGKSSIKIHGVHMSGNLVKDL